MPSDPPRSLARGLPRLTSPTVSVGPVIRDPDEEHRASTPLELFVDLTFVVAVAQAAASLHHELVEGHVGDGVVGFAMAFFGVWWAWMNFTWFASAHDANDVPYRLLTLVQIAGALVYAAAVPGGRRGPHVHARRRRLRDHAPGPRHPVGPRRPPLPRAAGPGHAVRHRHHDRAAAVDPHAGDPAGVDPARVPDPRRAPSWRCRSGPSGPTGAAASGASSIPSTSRSATACSRSSCSASRCCRRPSASAPSPRRASAPA